jgi:S1-C subfamily serine protease
VDNPSEVQVAVDQGRVGQPLAVRVQRGQRQLNLQLRPAELPRQN